jgi:hypothetical protein
VVWEQGKGPDLVVELLSASTAGYDKTTKKDLYTRQVRVAEYYWYDPFNPEDFAGFTLRGSDYQPLAIDAKGHTQPDLESRSGPLAGSLPRFGDPLCRKPVAGEAKTTAADSDRQRFRVLALIDDRRADGAGVFQNRLQPARQIG